MNLRQLQYFKTIAELEHYTRAAERLYVSQSNLSHSIQELEDELNVEFFVRKGRNIKLTKYGELFLPYVTKALDALDTGVACLQDYINPSTGTVTMACFPSLAQFIPEMIVRYFSDTDRVGVRVQFNQEASFYTLQKQIIDGAIDLVFCTEVEDPRVGCAHIGDHQVVLLVPERHRLAREERVDLRELDGENFIAFDSQCQLRMMTDAFFSNLHIRPNITMETAQDVIIYGMVAAGHGVAIVPRPLSGDPYNVRMIPIANDIPPRRLYVCWNKERYMPPAAEYFRDYIIQRGLIFDEFVHQRGLDAALGNS